MNSNLSTTISPKRLALSILLITTMSSSTWAQTEIYFGIPAFDNELNLGPATSGYETPVDSSFVLGIGYYYDHAPNIELGADVMTAKQRYDLDYPTSLSTTSFMATARYSDALNSTNMDYYVSGGIGSIYLNLASVLPTLSAEALKPGAQVEIGVSKPMGDIEFYAGIKYQTLFDQVKIESNYGEYNALSLVGGIRF